MSSSPEARTSGKENRARRLHALATILPRPCSRLVVARRGQGPRPRPELLRRRIPLRRRAVQPSLREHRRPRRRRSRRAQQRPPRRPGPLGLPRALRLLRRHGRRQRRPLRPRALAQTPQGGKRRARKPPPPRQRGGRQPVPRLLPASRLRPRRHRRLVLVRLRVRRRPRRLRHQPRTARVRPPRHSAHLPRRLLLPGRRLLHHG